MNPRLVWEIDEENYRFPTVILGGITWTAYHSVNEKTSEVDGHISNRTLDIWFVDAEHNDDLREDLPTISFDAHKTWNEGSVLCVGLWPKNGDGGIPSLILPGESWTDEIVVEAFKRFRP